MVVVNFVVIVVCLSPSVVKAVDTFAVVGAVVAFVIDGVSVVAAVVDGTEVDSMKQSKSNKKSRS